MVVVVMMMRIEARLRMMRGDQGAKWEGSPRPAAAMGWGASSRVQSGVVLIVIFVVVVVTIIIVFVIIGRRASAAAAL